MLINVTVAGEDRATAHVGELQLNLRAIVELKPLAHAAYNIVRGTELEHLEHAYS